MIEQIKMASKIVYTSLLRSTRSHVVQFTTQCSCKVIRNNGLCYITIGVSPIPLSPILLNLVFCRVAFWSRNKKPNTPFSSSKYLLLSSQNSQFLKSPLTLPLLFQETRNKRNQIVKKMGEAPKLYVHKPKKAKMKQVKGIDVQSSSSSTTKLPSSSAISSYYSTGSSAGGGSGGVLNPPEIPKESFARRYKYLWPMLLTVNLAIGAYYFMRTKKNDRAIEEEIATVTPASSTSIIPPTATVVTQNLHVAQAQPIRVLEPIPEMQQRELFKWMLEEKRKIKTNNTDIMKRLDEEKAILKQLIGAKSIPRI